MNPEALQFLSLTTKPARLTSEYVALLLGFMVHDIPILVAHGLLKPIGDPPVSGTKYFATADIEQLKSDRKWLSRATSCLHRHWQRKNGRKAKGNSSSSAALLTERRSDS